MRLTGSSFKDLMTNNNDDLAIKYFDRMEKKAGNQSNDVSNDKVSKSGGTGYGEPTTETA